MFQWLRQLILKKNSPSSTQMLPQTNLPRPPRLKKKLKKKIRALSPWKPWRKWPLWPWFLVFSLFYSSFWAWSVLFMVSLKETKSLLRIILSRIKRKLSLPLKSLLAWRKFRPQPTCQFTKPLSVIFIFPTGILNWKSQIIFLPWAMS